MNSNENIFSEENDDLKVEYEIINIEHSQDEEIKKYVKAKIKNIDSAIDINDSKLQEYNKQLKKLLIKQMLLTTLLPLAVEYWQE